MFLLRNAAVWQQGQLKVTPAPAVPSAPCSSHSLLWVGHRTGFREWAVKGNTSTVLPGGGGWKAAAGAEVMEKGSVAGKANRTVKCFSFPTPANPQLRKNKEM